MKTHAPAQNIVGKHIKLIKNLGSAGVRPSMSTEMSTEMLPGRLDLILDKDGQNIRKN